MHSEVLLVDHGARNHVNGVLDWAHCMTNSATCAVLFYDLRESVVPIKLDSLIAGVGACKEAATALQAVFIIDDRD